MEKIEEVKQEIKLTPKQLIFCAEYCVDFNATNAAIQAGYSKRTACSIGSENLRKPEVQAQIRKFQANLSEASGISALRVLNEHKKIAFSNIADFHTGWITLKEFDSLSEDQKASIAEIKTKSETRIEKNGDEAITVKEDYVFLKLYDKQKSLDSISKMLGFESPQKIELGFKDEIEIEIGFKPKKD